MDLSRFLLKYKKEVHESLNYLWEAAAELREVFSREFQTSQLMPALNSYILIGSKWCKQKYPIPAFKFSIGEVSVNLESASAVISVYSSTINEKFLAAVTKHTSIEIYGGKNFLHTFYKSPMKVAGKTA